MLVGFCSDPFGGRVGNGKTFFLTAIGAKFAKEGYPIFSNYEVRFPYTEITSFEEIFDINHGVVLIDELKNYLSCYDHVKFSTKESNIFKEFFVFMNELRKRKVKVFFTNQLFTKVHKSVREMTDEMYICSKHHVDTGNVCASENCEKPHHFIAYEHLRNKQLKIAWQNAKKVFDLYDTNYIIGSRVFV